MASSATYERPVIAGSGRIACGLAACAATIGEVRLLARSDASAWRAEEAAQKAAAKTEGANPGRIKVTTDPGELADCDLVVEAIVEDAAPKVELLAALGEACPGADLATTTSSLLLAELRDRSGLGSRFFGLHVFNPVPRDGAGRALPSRRRSTRGLRERAPRLVRGARQDRDRGPRPGGVRRQPAALPATCSRRCG